MRKREKIIGLVVFVGFLVLMGFLICTNMPFAGDDESIDVTLKWEINEMGGITIIGTEDNLLQEISIPTRISGRIVTEIAEEAFADCHNLSRIEIPATVTKIGEHAFRFCDCIIIVTACGTYAEQYAMQHGIEFSIR